MLQPLQDVVSQPRWQGAGAPHLFRLQAALMPTTKRDLRALHYLAQRLREETRGARTWDDNGLHAVLGRMEGHNLAVTIERVCRHSADPEAKTPGAIERPFVPELAAPGPPRPPKPAECCRLCGRALHAPDVVCDQPTQRPTPAAPPTDTYLAAKSGLNGASHD